MICTAASTAWTAAPDDYIVKPFDMAELQARMRAVLRRHGGQAQTLLSNSIITLNPFHPSGQKWSGGNRPLCSATKRICRPPSPAAASGHDSVAQRLEDKIYGWGEEVESNAVDFPDSALRKKLGKAIQNIRGVGWLVTQNNQAV